MLLDELIKDERKVNRVLYSSGPYWDYKNKRAALEIKKKGLKDFRGLTSGIGTSFADNLTLDIRNELGIKGSTHGDIKLIMPAKKAIESDTIIKLFTRDLVIYLTFFLGPIYEFYHNHQCEYCQQIFEEQILHHLP